VHDGYAKSLPPRLQEFADLLDQGLTARQAVEKMGLGPDSASVMRRRLRLAREGK
jgi:hypothetical protein